MTTDILTSPVLARAEEIVLRAFQIMAPPPKRTMSEWADGRIILSSKVSPEPGPLRLSRIPYAIEVLDCLTNPRTREVTLMWAAQVAKTTVGVDIPTAYYMHQDPSRIAVFLEDEDKQKTWSITRLLEMVNNTPDLSGLFSHKGGPDSKNTIEYKDFPGGRLSILNSGSAADLSSMSQRVVIKDELDKWKTLSAGDPDSLADKRAQNSFNKKIINVSTPRDHNPDQKIYSRITVKYEASDKRKYHVPCIFCNHIQILREDHLRFINKKGDDIEDAKYECEKCNALISNRHKNQMLMQKNGARWIAEKPFVDHAGFWLNALYSVWIPWREYGLAKIRMCRQHDTHKTFQNEWRALPWNPMIEHEKDLSPYLARREYYEKVPLFGMPQLTCFVDIQHDRIEVDVRSWGVSREVWGVEHKIFWGKPAMLTTGYLPPVWQELEAFRQKTWTHESGEICRIGRMFVDSGYLTSEVMKYCKGKRPMVWPTKGMSDINSKHPLVSSRPQMDKKARYKYYQIGPNEAKDIIAANLAAEPPKVDEVLSEKLGRATHESSAGYMHFNQTYDVDFFKQLLVSERQVRIGGLLVWRRLPGNPSNEGLDLSVGNLAAFESWGVDPKPYVEAMVRQWEARQKQGAETRGRGDGGTGEKERQQKKEQTKKPLMRKLGGTK